MAEYLPNVTEADLEGFGKVYYMNGADGTEFEFHVNRHLPPFMVFYNTKENLGAAKVILYADGTAVLYLYSEGGKKLLKEVRTSFDADDILNLAVIMKHNADDMDMWDIDIKMIDSDVEPNIQMKSEFLGTAKDYEDSVTLKKIMDKYAVVSKKITEEGWMVGYMLYEEPRNDFDSGWQFLAGNEDEAFMDSADNFVLVRIVRVWQLDHVIAKYIGNSLSTSLIRVSLEEFEEDNGQDQYLDRWKK